MSCIGQADLYYDNVANVDAELKYTIHALLTSRGDKHYCVNDTKVQYQKLSVDAVVDIELGKFNSKTLCGSMATLGIFGNTSRQRAAENLEEDSLARQSDVIVSTNITSYAEYKGFFIYVISALVLGTWIAWAILPDVILRDYLYIGYYPNKYWSLAIPSYLLMSMLYIYIATALYNKECLTLPLNDVRNIVDEYSHIVGSNISDPRKRLDMSIDYIWDAPSGVWDMPITLVNEVLYNEEFDTSLF